MMSQDFSETFKFELGCERTLRVLESKNSEEETIIDVRLFADDQPTEKGQAMTLSRWRILCDNVEQIDQKLEEVKRDERVDYRLHLGANVHVSITSPYKCVNIRKFEFARNSAKKKMYPTTQGLSLRIPEWNRLNNNLHEINFQLPVELDSVVPCYARPDHSNQMGLLECPECNPNLDIDNI